MRSALRISRPGSNCRRFMELENLSHEGGAPDLRRTDPTEGMSCKALQASGSRGTRPIGRALSPAASAVVASHQNGRAIRSAGAASRARSLGPAR
jgi:hypothetical protein